MTNRFVAVLKFGLAVKSQPKLSAEIKEVCKNSSILDQPFAIEVFAQSPTAEKIPVEFWWLWVDPDNVDKDVPVRYAVYNRMAILLKSVIVVLRASPINRFVMHCSEVRALALIAPRIRCLLFHHSASR